MYQWEYLDLILNRNMMHMVTDLSLLCSLIVCHPNSIWEILYSSISLKLLMVSHQT